jgi:hypothetical protein
MKHRFVRMASLVAGLALSLLIVVPAAQADPIPTSEGPSLATGQMPVVPI